MRNSYDIAIIGAGPAGMSAAITAVKAGSTVVVLDDKKQAGGQIYRNVSHSPLPNPESLGSDYTKGRSLVTEFEASGVTALWESTVWHVGDNGEILFSQKGVTKSLTAREIIISCGAMERPFPVPGWHLPGVMSAGSAQVMLKNDAMVRDNAVFVGTGPLLYLIVAQYIRLGVEVKALVDTTPLSSYTGSAPYLPGALAHARMLVKGMGLLNEIRKAGVTVYRFAENIAIEGDTEAKSIKFNCGGSQIKFSAEHVFLHQGVIPNLNMTRSLGVDHHWCAQQLCWKPTLDIWGESSVASIAVAGDCSGIVGADAAVDMGRVVALQRLVRLDLITEKKRDQLAADALARIKKLNRFRKFIDRLYRPQDLHRIPQQEDTVVCRCEEQTVGQLKAGFDAGANGPDELKGLTRCGMGPCQGRQCGHTVSELLAQWRGVTVSDIGYYRLRSPMRLLNLSELSQFTHVAPGYTEEKS